MKDLSGKLIIYFSSSLYTKSGGVIAVGLIQMFLGYSGLFSSILRFVSPITITCVITAIGLGLYGVAFSGVADCWPLGLTIIFLCLLFCLYLPRVKIFGFSLFGLFPILIAITLTWSLGGILTATGVFESDSMCSTSQSLDYVDEVPWFWLPYPFQFGTPQFKSYAIVPMIGSMLASMVEVRHHEYPLRICTSTPLSRV